MYLRGNLRFRLFSISKNFFKYYFYVEKNCFDIFISSLLNFFLFLSVKFKRNQFFGCTTVSIEQTFNFLANWSSLPIARTVTEKFTDRKPSTLLRILSRDWVSFDLFYAIISTLKLRYLDGCIVIRSLKILPFLVFDRWHPSRTSNIINLNAVPQSSFPHFIISIRLQMTKRLYLTNKNSFTFVEISKIEYNKLVIIFTTLLLFTYVYKKILMNSIFKKKKNYSTTTQSSRNEGKKERKEGRKVKIIHHRRPKR